MAQPTDRPASAASVRRWTRAQLPLWLRGYRRGDLGGDVIAGTVTAILLVPQGVAFALLAGLPPQMGLYASVLGPLIYGLLGSSRTLSVGPVSVAAVMIASALATPGLAGTPVQSAGVLALECALILFALAVLRLGWLMTLLSHPVLSGFTAGAAVLIIFSQLPPLAGFRGPAAIDGWQSYRDILFGLGALTPATLAVGLGAVLALLALGRPLTRGLARTGWPAQVQTALSKSATLAVVLVSSVLVLLLGWGDRVEQVGPVASGLPSPDAGLLRSPDWLLLLPSALGISVVGYVESMAIAKALASRRRETVSANRELLALGAANLAGAAFGAMPVAGGLSRTLVNFSAGARTQLASVISALLVALALLLMAPWFAVIPKAALAAIIIVAVAPLIDGREFLKLWRYDRGDGLVFALTAGAVLVAGIGIGLVAGIGLSMALFIWRAAHPHIAEIGRVPGTQHYRNLRRHAVQTWPGLCILRVDESLSFVNALTLRDHLYAAVLEGDAVRHVVLVCSAINHVDSSALEMLHGSARDLRDLGVTLHLAEVKGPVMDRLRDAGALQALAPGKIFFHVDEAVQALTSDGSA